MGELREAKSRWSRKMPKFFKKMMKISALISGTALAANEAMQLAGITPDDWWTEALKYLVSVPAGVMFACKFAVAGGVEEDADGKTASRKESGNTELNQDNF